MKHVAAHRPVDESVNNIALLTSLNRNDYTTIREIQECQDRSNHFRILARVVDFYPLRLQTCVGCSRCQKEYVAPKMDMIEHSSFLVSIWPTEGVSLAKMSVTTPASYSSGWKTKSETAYVFQFLTQR